MKQLVHLKSTITTSARCPANVRGVNNMTGVALVEVYAIDEIVTTD